MRLVRNEFIENPSMTIGADFMLSRMESTIEPGGLQIKAKVQIWDTAPRERYALHATNYL
jgi:GTPase SAR1 family protein